MNPRALIRTAAQQLTAAGVPDARQDAGLLLSHVTGIPALTLQMDSDTELSQDTCETFQQLVEKRCQRVPLQYLTKGVSFLGHAFYVDERVLIPRPETELLAEHCIKRLQAIPQPMVLDLCCGSGCLGISIALGCPHATVHGADLSAKALAVSRYNAERLSAPVTFHQGDLFDALPSDLAFDLIVSNPPYIPAAECLTLQQEVLQEPAMALDGGTDGLDFYRAITQTAPKHLRSGGRLLMEVGWNQAQEVLSLMTAAGFTHCCAHEDYQHIQRIVEGYLP